LIYQTIEGSISDACLHDPLEGMYEATAALWKQGEPVVFQIENAALMNKSKRRAMERKLGRSDRYVGW
jgi:hypothetical protein